MIPLQVVMISSLAKVRIRACFLLIVSDHMSNVCANGKRSCNIVSNWSRSCSHHMMSSNTYEMGPGPIFNLSSHVRTVSASDVTLLALCEGNSPVTSGFPSQRARNVGFPSQRARNVTYSLIGCDHSHMT